MYRLTMTERQECIREERRRRSVARLVQVRQQASRAADRTRQRVQAESARQLAKLKQAAAAEYAADKENRLQHLEAEYSACLRQVGAAHLAAARQPDLTAVKRLVATEQQQVAEERQQAALRRVRDSQRQLHDQRRRTDTLRELNRAMERVRADRVAQEGLQRRQQEQERQQAAARSSTAASSDAAGTVVFQSAFRPRVSFRDDAVQTRPRPRCRRTRALQTAESGSMTRDPTTNRGSQTRALGRDKKTGTRFPQPAPAPAASSGPSSAVPVSSVRSGGTTSSRVPQTSDGGSGRSEAPTAGTSSVSVTDVPHSESALTPSELQRHLSSASTGRPPPAAAGVPLRSETRPPPKQYQVRREQSEYDARAAAREQTQLQQAHISSELLRQHDRDEAAAERGRQAQRRLSARSEYTRLLTELELIEAEERRERRQAGAGPAQQLVRATASLAQQDAGALASYEERQRRLTQLFEDALLLAADAESEGDQSAELVTPARDLAAEFDRHGRHVAELMAGAPPTVTDGIAAGVQAVNAARSRVARSSLSVAPPGTWTAAGEQSTDQSQYSSVSAAEPTSQWVTDESAAGAGQQQYAIRADLSQPYTAGQGYRAEQPVLTQQTADQYQPVYDEEEQQMFEPERGMHGLRQEISREDGQEMYGQEGQEAYGLQGEPLPGLEEDQYAESGEQSLSQAGDEADRSEVYTGPDGIYPVRGPDRPDITSPDVSSLRTADVSSLHTADVSSVRTDDLSSLRTDELSSLRTSDVSTVRSSELSALASSSGAAAAGQTLDSTVTAYQRAPGDPGDPALAAGLLHGAPAAVGSHGQLRQYVSQLLDESRERLSRLGLPGSSPSTVYGSVSAGSLSRSGAADVTFGTAPSPADLSADVGDGAAAEELAVGPERSGTSGVYSEEPSQSAAQAAASDGYLQRYDEVLQKLSEVQQRRDELMRSYSSAADELRGSAAEMAATRSSDLVRPRPPPSLSRAVVGGAPHELSTILEQSRTTPQEGSAGMTGSSGGTRPTEVTSTGSLLSRTGPARSEPDASVAAGAGGRDDTLSQFSNLASSQEYLSQEWPRPDSAVDRPGTLGSASEVSLRSSVLERALEASREAIRSVSHTEAVQSQSGQSSPDVGRIISKLGMTSRSGALADRPQAELSSSSSSGSAAAQRQASRVGRSSGDELRRRVLSRQSVRSSSSSSSSTPSSSSGSSSISSVGSGSPAGSPSAGSSGLLAPLDLSAAPPPTGDSSLDTDKFEAGVAAGGVQSTPMKRTGAAPEGGPVAGLSGAVSMRPRDLTLPASSEED